MSTERTVVKVMVLGDGAVGKTCLLISYCTGQYPVEYVPTAFDNYACEIQDAKGRNYLVGFWDTAGGEDYHRLRPLSYPQTDIFLICFDISNRSSFDNITPYWIPELDHFMPDTPRLIVGCKADLREPLHEDPNHVTYREAMELSRELGTSYVETSAKERKGLDMCVLEALRLASLPSPIPKRKFFWQKFSSKKQNMPAPVLPSKERPPIVVIEPSTFSEDLQGSLEESTQPDVIFVTRTKHRLKAEKVVLCSASDFFCNLFDVPTTGQQNASPDDEEGRENKQLDDKIHSPCEALVKDSQISAVSRITREADGKPYEQTEIELGSEVTSEMFIYVLQFLYTGNPKFPDDISELDLDKVIRLSQSLELPLLEMFCNNLKGEDAYLNPSISSYHMETVGRRMKGLFINKTLFSDVVFKVNDAMMPAHKCVLTMRSNVMAAMLSGSFKEGKFAMNEIEIPDTTEETFLALLEYLYTDHAPIDNQNSVDILVLADRFCLSRLINLCEEYISRNLTSSDDESTREEDVIPLVHISRMYNAKQLEECCLHFMATNYSKFKDREDFLALDEDTRQYVEHHQWPPLSYMEELEEHENRLRFKIKKCSVM